VTETPAARNQRVGMTVRSRFAALGQGTLIVLAIAAVKLLGTMVVSNRYGVHRDEFYYIASARHLNWGYVDYPPVTPLLARLDLLVFGVSLPGLRLLSILAGTIAVVLAALIARDLGGNPTAQVLAALAVLLNPLFLGGNILFQTVTFDQLTWLIVLFLIVRLLNSGDPRLWLAIGFAFGIGLETKYTIVALALGVIVGVLITPLRQQLRTPWPWLGVAIALLLLLPNLLWQVQHNWPSLTYIHSHQANTSSRLGFIAETLFLLGLIGLPLAILGSIELYARQRYRMLAWTALVATLVLFLSSGKSYYAGPLYPLLLAAGSVRATHLFRDTRRRLWTIVATLSLLTVPLIPLGLPVLPARAAIDAGLISARKDYADMFGWQELTASVARVYDSLPQNQRARVTIWADNYGEAGAIDLYGSKYGLPRAIASDLSYFYWKPNHVDDRTVIAVGLPKREVLERFFRSIRLTAVIHNVYGVQNEENGKPIYVCTKPKLSLDKAWHSLQGFG
jgi:Dolichyl-phosphate-mannose-protein mannosyltransferase